MKILVHDYCGHPFPVQLSRELARRGHHVHHVYYSQSESPKGRLRAATDDPATLIIADVSWGEAVAKHTLIKRFQQERRLGKLLRAMIGEIQPDIVLSANSPLEMQWQIMKGAADVGAAFIFWLQDIHGLGIKRILARRLPGVGHLVGQYYRFLENTMLRRSSAIIAITDDFAAYLSRYGIGRDKVDVIENWAALEELAPEPRENAWSRQHNHGDRYSYLYSGTLGYKHNAELLLHLARNVDGLVTVLSEGKRATELRARAESQGLGNLQVLPWVPYDQLPAALSSADVLVAMIEEDAGVFSVPSKVLTYMCVGRPLLLSVPRTNLAARLVLREQAGLVSSPGDPAQFLAHARRLATDRELRERMGANARRYAERAFRIEGIADRFEAVLKRSYCSPQRLLIPADA